MNNPNISFVIVNFTNFYVSVKIITWVVTMTRKGGVLELTEKRERLKDKNSSAPQFTWSPLS